MTPEWPPLTAQALARPNTAPTKSFVYLFVDRDRHLVKIGISQDPDKRLAELRHAHGTTIELLGVLAGDRDLERELHREFADQREYGEWFRGCQRIEDLVWAMFEAAKRYGTYDPAYEDELAPVYTQDEVFAAMLGVSVNAYRKMSARAA